MSQYEYTNKWFDVVKPVWDKLIPSTNPRKILEIGSYEGASTCYLIDKLADGSPLEIHCIDSWEGGVEHQKGGAAEVDMSAVEVRFLSNTNLAISKSPKNIVLAKHKGYSDIELSRLIADGKSGYFDFIYVDGSHQAPDVICDAILSYKLLKKNGVIVFDDYLWSEPLKNGIDPIRCPKIAIDAFTNIFCRKIQIMQAPLYQIYVQKISD